MWVCQPKSAMDLSVTEEEVQAEAERAYLEDDSPKPDIPQDLQERFNKIDRKSTRLNSSHSV